MLLIFGIFVGMLMTFIVYGAYILLIAFTLWMAVDAAKQDRYWWIVIVLGIPIVGSAVYFFTEKKHEYAKVESHHIHDTQTETQHETAPAMHHHRRKDDPVEEVALAQISENEVKEEVRSEEPKEEETKKA